MNCSNRSHFGLRFHITAGPMNYLIAKEVHEIGFYVPKVCFLVWLKYSIGKRARNDDQRHSCIDSKYENLIHAA